MKEFYLANNPFNLHLVQQNSCSNDTRFVMLRYAPDEKNLIKKIVPGANAINIYPPKKSIYLGNRYYSNIAKNLDALNLDRLIVFHNCQPYSRFLIDWGLSRNIETQMWEDGVNHYIKEFNHGIQEIKTVLKIALGHYRSGIFNNNYRANDLVIRDRFIRKNLIYSPNVCSKPTILKNSVAFVGQPLAEDSYITKKQYSTGLQKIRSRFKNHYSNFHYFPHPREKLKNLKRAQLHRLKYSIIDTDGMSLEDYLVKNRYGLIVSAYSTVILNLYNIYKCAYVPTYFGLNSTAKKLSDAFSSDITIL